MPNMTYYDHDLTAARSVLQEKYANASLRSNGFTHEDNRLLQNIYRNCVAGLGFLFFFFTRPHGTHVLAIGDHSEFWSRALLRRFFLSLLFIFFKEKAEMIGHRLFTRQSNSRGDTRDSHEGKASSSRTARPVCNFHRG